jgi:CTD kinase subunit beta
VIAGAHTAVDILQEVCLTTLYVSSKLHDTLKKPIAIILASYSLRFPHLVKRGSTVDPSAVDPAMLEHDRKRVLSVERLVLETMCFHFGVQMPFTAVVKLGRALGREF